jgi:hypothetical protein
MPLCKNLGCCYAFAPLSAIYRRFSFCPLFFQKRPVTIVRPYLFATLSFLFGIFTTTLSDARDNNTPLVLQAFCLSERNKVGIWLGSV